MTEAKKPRILTREIRDAWELQCARYQSMKHKVLKVLEHPESTEEQMMDAAALLRSARTNMVAMRESLSNLFGEYFVTLDGWKVKDVHNNKFCIPYETRKGKLERLLKEDAEAKSAKTN
jgi:hypothetical protein